ncbi:hypothetical protein J3R82DRAFT_6964 [Butyriboletus roseoflavus]|nr:hypothetical protein J3R82DRAFT_6964 [Butyriboletus roseoflavus]
MAMDAENAQFPCLDTPYSKYSNTNYAASGQDIHAIDEIVRQRQAQLHDVTAELATVESIMKRVRDVHQRLLDKRDQIVASMEVHQGLVSCIRRLPTEILGEIFVRCLPPNTHIEPDIRTAPLLLMGVCRGWRKVVLGTPRLWCSLSVRPSHRVLQQGLFFYHHWLSRARGCPLSLAVDTRRPPQNLVWRYEVTELLQPYMSRSARLHVTFDEATAPDMLLKDIPMLEHLTLEGDLRTAQKQKMTIVQPEPRLRSLTLCAVALGTDVLSAFDPGWTHLTQLRVTLGRAPRRQDQGADGPIVLSLLALCPHLEEFVFSPVFISRHDVDADAPHARGGAGLTHARLHTLDVVVLYGAGCLLDALTLPALKDLKIRDLDIVPSAWRQNALKAFLTRSGCPLETLRIHGAHVSIRKEDRAEYTALVPTLKHLDVCLGVMMHG